MKKVLFLWVFALLIIGCSNKEPEPCNCPEPIQVNPTKIIEVPVKCPIPEIDCDFTGDKFAPTGKLLECVVLLKHTLEACK